MFWEFAAWWVTQMRGLLPSAWLPAATDPDARIITIDPPDPAGSRPACTVTLRRGGQETAIGRLDLSQKPQPSGPPTGLRLPRGQFLRRQVTLPLAASRNLETVIGFEMDRLTPFTADELFWSIGGVKPDRALGRISVDLFIVVRAQVETLLQTLRSAGLAPAFIEAGTGRIDLAAAHRPARRRQAMLAVCALLALACLATPFIRQQMALTGTANTIAAVAPAAAVAQKLRQQLDIATAGEAAIANARRTGDALVVLAALTAALPDGTWLDDLTLKSGDLTIDGESSDAAALIGRLSAVKMLQDPSFTAPVTRAADGSADQFSIHAGLRE